MLADTINNHKANDDFKLRVAIIKANANKFAFDLKFYSAEQIAARYNNASELAYSINLSEAEYNRAWAACGD